MNISRVETFIVRMPIRRQISDATHDFTHWSVAGCWLHTDEGLVGTGYTGLEGDGEDLIAQVIDRYYAPVLIGRDPSEISAIWEDLQWGRLHWVGRAGITQMALAAVDIALWDLVALASGVPLWKLLGGHKTQRIDAYNTDGGWLNWSIDELVADTTRLIEQGWSGVKIKVGCADPADDRRRVAAVRAAIGDGPMLMVDANMAWDPATARARGQQLEDYRLDWLEEPLHPDDVASHAQLARELRTPIAVGESLYHRFVFRDYLAADAAAIIQADVTRVGGVTEWLRIAGMAASFNRPVIPHAGDMVQVHQHLVAATANAPMIEYIPWIRELFTEPVVVADGRVVVPRAPGASTTMRPESLQRWRVA
jgi:L-alanine-DL-glutamate epimerase-like enolase superfamily enzyme